MKRELKLFGKMCPLMGARQTSALTSGSSMIGHDISLTVPSGKG
jgi:hypothetical protein